MAMIEDNLNPALLIHWLLVQLHDGLRRGRVGLRTHDRSQGGQEHAAFADFCQDVRQGT